MAVNVITGTEGSALNVLGEQVRPLAPAGALSIEIFDTTGPEQAGPPPHRHPWDEIYVVLEGML